MEKATNATIAETTTTEKITETTETTTQISNLAISNDVKNLSSQMTDMENQLSQGVLSFKFRYFLPVLSIIELVSYRFKFNFFIFQILMRNTRN